MSYAQIRLNKNNELQEMISFLKQYYKASSEAEILKRGITDLYINARDKVMPLPISVLKKESDPVDITNKEWMLQAAHAFGIHSKNKKEPADWWNKRSEKPLPSSTTTNA